MSSSKALGVVVAALVMPLTGAALIGCDQGMTLGAEKTAGADDSGADPGTGGTGGNSDAGGTGGSSTGGTGGAVSRADAGGMRGTDANSASCPRAIDEGQGQSCQNDGDQCTYMDGTCACDCVRGGGVGVCLTPLQWMCNRPGPGCPSTNPGPSACMSEGTSCRYGCAVVTCAGAEWRSNLEGCQGGVVSSRTAKRDIAYLSEPDQRKLAQQVMQIKLATYEYKDRALAGKRRLGFIIEDNPHLPAIDRSQSTIDLDGYASMLVAVTQSQAREISVLRSQLDLVMRRLDKPRRGTSLSVRGRGGRD